MSNINGFENTASGAQALFHNTHGTVNTAVGCRALYNNTDDGNNVAIGFEALYSNTTGSSGNSTAIGFRALYSNTTGGGNNTAVGSGALGHNTTGNFNIALGESAGFLLTTGFSNIDIGNSGAAGDSNTIHIGTQGTQTATLIAGIYGTPIVGGVPVVINANGQLGVAAIASSSHSTPASRGLKRQLARYEALNAMLLNEFLKEHRTVQELKVAEAKQEAKVAKQDGTIAHQQKQIEALTAGLQKVSDQLELSKPAPRTVSNNQ